MSKSKSRKFADILSGNLATVLDDGIISASEVASLGTAATTDSTAYATAAQGTTADNALPKAGGAMTGAITTNSTFDGRDIATDGAKLDGIETGATADQTAAQILTAIKTVDGASSGLDADLLDGQEGSYYTNYADTAIANLTDSAPSTLNTLNELAAALGDDANFSTTVTNSIAAKLPLSGGTMTGNIAHASNFTLDVGGELALDADASGTIRLKDGGTEYATIWQSGGLAMYSAVADSDIKFKGNDSDGGSAFDALTLDMSDAGTAIFNNKIVGGTTLELEGASSGNLIELEDGSGNNIGNIGLNFTDNLFIGGNSSHAGLMFSSNSILPYKNGAYSTTIDMGNSSSGKFQHGHFSGNLYVDGTVDGRDIATDGTKLDTIETNADVTDTANVVSALTAGSNITIAANGTISSTDTNTTYSVQDGELSQNNFTNADHTKLNSIETNADVTDTTNVVAALTAGTNVAIAANGTISSTDTNTTYSVGDGGLTQKNFTTTLKSKLDGIESGATADQSASEISGLEEFVEDQIGANIIGGSNVSVSYNDSTGQTTLSSTDTNTTYSAGSGLGLSGTTFSHTDTSSQASVNNSGRTYIQDITLDTYGHITGITSATETVVNTDTNTTYNVGGGLTQSGTTFYHADTSSQGSINNSGSNFIQDITVDTYGHITGITSAEAGGGDPFPAAPTWTSPDATYTSSGSWSKDSSIGNDDWVIFHLISGGGSGNAAGSGSGGKGGALVLAVKGSSITSSVSFSIGAGGGYNGYGGFANAGQASSITISGKTFSSGFGGGASYYGDSGGHGDGVLAWPGGSTPATILTVDDVRGGGSLGGGTSNAGNAGSGGYYGAGGNGALRIHW